MSKYNFEFKKIIVHEYLDGEADTEFLQKIWALRYDCDKKMGEVL